MLQKCNKILADIKKSNTGFKFDDIVFYISRSIVPNAVCYGNGIIMVNLGLLLWIDNNDELAFVLAHEIAHQVLNHYDKRLSNSIEVFTSEGFNEEVADIKKATSGKYERYKKLMKEIVIEGGKHSTYKEAEADSLAYTLIKKANYNTKVGPQILLKLEYVDDLFSSDKIFNVKNSLTSVQFKGNYFQSKTRYNGLSGAEVTMNADADIDSVKTHPDCKLRFKQVTKETAPNITNCCTIISTQNSIDKENALIEMVRYEFEVGKYVLSIHFSMLALESGYNKEFFNAMIAASYAMIYQKDKQYERFTAVNASASGKSSLKQLQDLLFKLDAIDIRILSKHYLDLVSDKTSEGFLFASMLYDSYCKELNFSDEREQFIKKFPNSRYSYILNLKN